jgi:hypothetical protein
VAAQTGAVGGRNSVVSLGLRFAVRVDRRGILLAWRFAHTCGPRLQTVFSILISWFAKTPNGRLIDISKSAEDASVMTTTPKNSIAWSVDNSTFMIPSTLPCWS